MARARLGKLVLIAGLTAVVSGCAEGEQFNPFQPRAETTANGTEGAARSVRLVERDVEAPDVFQVSNLGLWDGRPSLGGIWVAYPGVQNPERVIIRNEENGSFVIGALFRRERENPGPRIQVSSDAAAALGMLAGQPAALNVTALRREEVPVEPEVAATPIETPEEIVETEIDPIAAAAAAIEAGEDAAAEAAPSAAPAVSPAPVPAPARTASGLAEPFIQIGIFNVEENASATATSLRLAGMVPIVKEQSSQGRTFWRVIVGPASDSTERATLLRKIKDLGFDDAYFVTN